MTDLEKLTQRWDDLEGLRNQQDRDMVTQQNALILACTYGTAPQIADAVERWRKWRQSWIAWGRAIWENAMHLDLITEAPVAERRCGTCAHWIHLSLLSTPEAWGDCRIKVGSPPLMREGARCDDWQEAKHD